MNEATQTVLVLTPEQLFNGIVSICVGISAIAAALGVVYKAVKSAQSPNKRQDERLNALESKTKRHDELFENDNRRLAAIEKGNRVTQRSILALLSHGIDGNEIQEMKDAKDELQKFLIDR